MKKLLTISVLTVALALTACEQRSSESVPNSQLTTAQQPNTTIVQTASPQSNGVSAGEAVLLGAAAGAVTGHLAAKATNSSYNKSQPKVVKNYYTTKRNVYVTNKRSYVKPKPSFSLTKTSSPAVKSAISLKRK